MIFGILQGNLSTWAKCQDVGGWRSARDVVQAYNMDGMPRVMLIEGGDNAIASHAIAQCSFAVGDNCATALCISTSMHGPRLFFHLHGFKMAMQRNVTTEWTPICFLEHSSQDANCGQASSNEFQC